MKKSICNKGKKALSFLLITGLLLLGILPVNTTYSVASENETELILNGDFSEEVDPEVGGVPNWRGDGCTLSIEEDDGNPYVVLGARGNGYSSLQQTVTGTFKEGDVINYSYMLKAPADPRRHSRFVIKYQNVDALEEALFSSSIATGSWVEVSGTHTLARDASSIVFQIDDGVNDEGTGSAYREDRADIHIDDFSVKKVGEFVDVPVDGVTVNPTTLTLTSGQSSTLTAAVQPSEAAQVVIWSSSNESIATVDEYTGLVTAGSAGTVQITATSAVDETKSASCTVTVPAIPVTGITLTPKTLSLARGTTKALTTSVQPSNATNKNVTWSTSNESVATVSNGTVTAVGIGTATITVASVADPTKTAKCDVTVTIAVENVTLDKETLSLVTGDSVALKSTVEPVDATDSSLTWSTSDESIAKVENGVVTAVAAGTAIITATSVSDSAKKAECTVTVSTAIPVTGVTLDKATLSLVVKGTGKLVATVQPATASNRELKWSTSNASVATVNNGTVTAVAVGTAKIIATSVGDNTKKAECTVTVTESGNVLKKGDSFKSGSLTYKIVTVNATNKNGTVQVAVASGNKKLKAVNIPNTVSSAGISFKVVSIAANAFKNNKQVTTVKIGKNINVINNGAFSGCTKLKKVTIGAALTKIGKNVFLNNQKLKAIDLSKSTKLKSVGSKTFKGILKNAKISVPKGRAKEYKKILKKGSLAKSVKVK